MRRSSTPGLLAGLPTADLQAQLTAAQQAYLALSSGSQVITVSYAQGAGSRAVTYQATDLPALQNLIRSLQQQLGIVGRARRPIRPVF
ncbi:phage head-tail adapter protein [Pseudomonas putida]|uniref:gpW family head-tail joining protein n=1 Tax=Pseudomonas TaxID=286 RepID=UPI0018E6925A|nr:gpW family head-tail joining protein [Pseudomonas putida]MBI6944213.1 phage head-tail adapter protein [Pseudomonas putida]MBI6960314.1 phage head-tail adapter protein [Pseudomonas putida]